MVLFDDLPENRKVLALELKKIPHGGTITKMPDEKADATTKRRY